MHRPLMFLATLGAVAAATDRIGFLADLYRATIWGTVFGPFFTPLMVGLVLFLIKWALTRSFDRVYAIGYSGLVVASLLTMQIAPTPDWDSIASLLLR